MLLKLKEKRFVIRSATLSAAVRELPRRAFQPTGVFALHWTLDVRTVPEFGDGDWQPQARHENLRIPVRRWMDLAEKSVAWSRPYDPITGEQNGDFYVYEIGDIRAAELRFYERVRQRIRFSWEGSCDVLLTDEFDKDVPFTILGWADFCGVTVEGRPGETAADLRRRLAEFLYSDDFTQGPTVDDLCPNRGGLEIVTTHFAPLRG